MTLCCEAFPGGTLSRALLRLVCRLPLLGRTPLARRAHRRPSLIDQAGRWACAVFLLGRDREERDFRSTCFTSDGEHFWDASALTRATRQRLGHLTVPDATVQPRSQGVCACSTHTTTTSCSATHDMLGRFELLTFRSRPIELCRWPVRSAHRRATSLAPSPGRVPGLRQAGSTAALTIT